MSQNEIKTAIRNAESSLNMEGLSVSDTAKALCEKLLAKEITMDEYISIVKQKLAVGA